MQARREAQLLTSAAAAIWGSVTILVALVGVRRWFGATTQPLSEVGWLAWVVVVGGLSALAWQLHTLGRRRVAVEWQLRQVVAWEDGVSSLIHAWPELVTLLLPLTAAWITLHEPSPEMAGSLLSGVMVFASVRMAWIVWESDLLAWFDAPLTETSTSRRGASSPPLPPSPEPPPRGPTIEDRRASSDICSGGDRRTDDDCDSGATDILPWPRRSETAQHATNQQPTVPAAVVRLEEVERIGVNDGSASLSLAESPAVVEPMLQEAISQLSTTAAAQTEPAVIDESTESLDEESLVEERVDEELAEDADSPATAIQTMSRHRDHDGEWVEGTCEVMFCPGAKEAVLHLSFCPPLPAVPEFWMESLEGNDWQLKCAATYAFGVRIVVKRRSVTRDGQGHLVYRAQVPRAASELPSAVDTHAVDLRNRAIAG